MRARHGAVASDHPAASAIGVAALKAGGNAVDAACATALALGVGNPHASGIGGGGFALVYLAKEKKTYVLDFRETAPAALRAEMLLKDGKPDRKLSTQSGLAVGVPGEVRGLSELVRRWGKLPFARCVAPAETLARKGAAATERLAEMFGEFGKRDEAAVRALFAQVFATPAGPITIRPGDVLRRPALANTLAELRRRGPDAFYTGRIAREIVEASRKAGGVLTLEDLAGYRTVLREPLVTSYAGFTVHTMPPPSSGGVVIAQALGILERVAPDPKTLGQHSSAFLHLLTESLRHGFADRARHLGDPGFVQMPLAKLMDPAYHAQLAARVRKDSGLAQDQYGMPTAPASPPRDGGTAHLSVIDAEGNAVALTTTVNLWFGARIVAGNTGIVLNNQIDDFAIVPGVPNAFGLIGTEKNALVPGKRPLSSMSPTIVFEGERVKMAVGGAGGPTIISGTLQVMLGVLAFGLDAQAASAAPRLHHQWTPSALTIEPEIPQDVREGLVRRGHELRTRDHIAQVNVIVRVGDELEAASEFRGGGAPAGY